METKLNKPRKFSVMLKENDTNSCSYKIDRKLYDTLKKYLEPFRSFQSQPKKIKCIETGQIFRCANDANLILLIMELAIVMAVLMQLKKFVKVERKPPTDITSL